MTKMTLEQIEQKLMQGISDIVSASNAAEDITPDVPLADLGIDSLGLVEIFVFIEKNFNLKLLEANLKKKALETIRSLAVFISKEI